MTTSNLLTYGNPKTLKGESVGYMTFGLHLAPADLSGHQTCPKASAGCRAACLNKAGRGGMFRKGECTNVIQEARIRKTKMFFEQRDWFMALLVAEIDKAIRWAEKRNLIPCVRLNLTSDLPWEKIRVGNHRNIMAMFPNVQFYDYTAIPGRKVPANYHLTFSAKENNSQDIMSALLERTNVAMVFAGGLPTRWGPLGTPVVNGDEHDLRFTDPRGVIVGLKAKGPAKKDTSGFVRPGL